MKSRTKDKTDIDKIARLSTDDISLRKYKDTAQAQLDYLIKFMGEHDKRDTLFRYAVKSNFHEDGEDEHMWTQVYEFKDDYFIGTLTNEPSTLKKIKYGDTVKIFRQDVEDWLLQDFLTNTELEVFPDNIYVAMQSDECA
jgi:uncharacterized protein YegJ (DUF2314 family)